MNIKAIGKCHKMLGLLFMQGMILNTEPAIKMLTQ